MKKNNRYITYGQVFIFFIILSGGLWFWGMNILFPNGIEDLNMFGLNLVICTSALSWITLLILAIAVEVNYDS
jgi:hypothetical protein